MMTMKAIELTHSEAKVLSVIRATTEPIRSKEIAELTNLSVRQVFKAIENLRHKGIPVVASRNGTTGVKIAKTEEEKEKCIRTLTNQSAKILETSTRLKNADLETWKKRVKVM